MYTVTCYIFQISALARSNTPCSSCSSPSSAGASSMSRSMACTEILANVPAVRARLRNAGLTTRVESTTCPSAPLPLDDYAEKKGPTLEKCLSLLGRISRSGAVSSSLNSF